VAKVGPRLVRAETVAEIARAQGVDLRAALDVAVSDALLALGAESGPEALRPDVRLGVAGVAAHALLRQLQADTADQPITSEELGRATELRWIDVDRPEGFRTVHALVQVDKQADEATRARARDLGERIRAALGAVVEQAGSSTPPVRQGADPFRFDRSAEPDPAIAVFRRAVSAVDAGGERVRMEALPVVAGDGRIIDRASEPGSVFVREFAEAAAALQSRGQVSPVVTSPFGYHVIMLLERLPGRHATESERRAELRGDILIDRAKRAHRQLLSELRQRGHVERALNVDALLAQVKLE
jgi:peptidyl-prolyl cis-trans isomerase C